MGWVACALNCSVCVSCSVGVCLCILYLCFLIVVLPVRLAERGFIVAPGPYSAQQISPWDSAAIALLFGGLGDQLFFCTILFNSSVLTL